MQKYTFTIAIAALAVFIALLAACGEGEPNNLKDNETILGEIKRYIDTLIDPTNNSGLIYKCVGKGPDDGCPNESVNPEPTPPVGGDGTSSGSGESSGSKPIEDENCPANIRPLLPNFTCSWSPSSVKGGDNSRLSLPTYTIPSIMTCATSQKAWLEIVEGTGSLKFDTAFFSLNQDIKTSGPYQELKYNGRYLSEDFSKQWPVSNNNVNFVVNGRISCSGVADGKSYTCSKSLPCTPLVISPATAPTGNVTLTCNWPKLSEGTNNLAIGISPPACTSTGSISNPGPNEAGCDSPTPTIEYCGGTAISNCDFSKAGTVTVKAVATCKGGKYALQTLTYNVRDNYSIGACTWHKDRYIVSYGDTAKPSVSITNNYGRCNTTFDKNLPRKVTSSDVGKLSANATVNCTNPNANRTVTCPPVDVIASLYEINGKGDKFKLTNLPSGKIIVRVNIPTSNWQHNDAYAQGGAQGTASCRVTITPMLPSGCSGLKTITISGQYDLGRTSIGKPTCDKFELQLESSNCNQLNFWID